MTREGEKTMDKRQAMELSAHLRLKIKINN
jgi:hypothetical protein